MPTVSVIIPNYNHSEYLTKRIESVLNQTYTDFELIILDDHSKDDSLKVINRYRDDHRVAHIVVNNTNSGWLTNQWLTGMNLARGEWIWIAESDDYASPEFLQQFADCLVKNASMNLFYCDSAVTELMDGRYALYSERKKKLFHSDKWDNAYCADGITELNQTLKFDCTINNLSAVVFFKKHALEVLNQAAPMRYYGDWLLLIGLAARGTVCYCPLPLNHCRIHAASLLNGPTNELISKQEYYRILMTLMRHPLISQKSKLRRHFSFNYLSFGLKQQGIGFASAIVKLYIALDLVLGSRVITDIVSIKLFYKYFKKRYALKIDEV